MQHRRVQIGDVVPIFHRVKTEFIGSTVGNTALHTAPRQPYGKPVRMMIAPVRILRTRRPAKLGTPDNKRIVQ